ncbi:hypothetical protein BN1051_00922 [Arthrobacter saudimassiliensis]|uniref:Uncharacterized protein n=1 Tax=Arthrobacter saudimassiliensis TaxID=1461584 RepID=A0A078MQE0_9MICC|nr:hypothetical protein BN1051_00922 [Arthrobacter saudimassiliensis]
MRVRFPDGHTVDTKAVAWTRSHVLAHWFDDEGQAQEVWVPTSAVFRIRRAESFWQDPYGLP